MTGSVTGIRRRRGVAGRRETPHLPLDRDFYGQTLDSFNRIQECKRIELNYTADNMLKLDQKECCVISNAVDILSNRISAMVDAKDGVSIVSIKRGKFINGKWFDSSVGRSFQISYIYNAVINKLCKSQSGMVKRDCVYVNVEANNK